MGIFDYIDCYGNCKRKRYFFSNTYKNHTIRDIGQTLGNAKCQRNASSLYRYRISVRYGFMLNFRFMVDKATC